MLLLWLDSGAVGFDKEEHFLRPRKPSAAFAEHHNIKPTLTALLPCLKPCARISLST